MSRHQKYKVDLVPTAKLRAGAVQWDADNRVYLRLTSVGYKVGTRYPTGTHLVEHFDMVKDARMYFRAECWRIIALERNAGRG